MGTAIKAFGLDKNADAAEGDWGLGVKKRGWEREMRVGGETGLSAERPVQLMPLHRGPKLPPIQ